MKTQLQKLTRKALAQARKMGREAAKEDGWMEPLPEEHDETDYGEFTDAHRKGGSRPTTFGTTTVNLSTTSPMKRPQRRA